MSTTNVLCILLQVYTRLNAQSPQYEDLVSVDVCENFTEKVAKQRSSKVKPTRKPKAPRPEVNSQFCGNVIAMNPCYKAQP